MQPDTLQPNLVVYGPLGIFCLVLIYAVIAQWKARNTDRDAFDKAFADLRKEYQAEMNDLIEAHKREMSTLMERHVSKAETWVEKGMETANNLHSVLDAIERKMVTK